MTINCYEVGSIEHAINCYEDDPVDDVFTESEGSLRIFITSARQWMSTKHNHHNVSARSIFLGKPQTPDRPVLLGKIQTPATEVYSTALEFANLLDLVSIQSGELQSVVEEVIHALNINPEELHNLQEEIKSILNISAADIERQKPKEFEIEIFIDIIAREVCSKQEFSDKYGPLFRGSTDAIFMRTKRFLEEEDTEEKACCGICEVEFMPGVDEVVVMPCSDAFHKMCIGRWLNDRSNICPACYWSPGISKLPPSSSELQQAKQLFDRIQEIGNTEGEISKCNIL